jgi:polyisoprenyl-teichoic acid--peptidoglycan teichoic acid transferase
MKHKFIRLYGNSIKRIFLMACALITIFVIVKGSVEFERFTHTTGLTPNTLFRLATHTSIDDLRPIDGRVNVLILGIAGGDHDGSDLTDTMLVLSFDIKNNLSLISIPRDIWSDNLKDKINSAYHYGEEKGKSLPAGRLGGGLVLAKATISDVIGLPIQYSMVFNFSGFESIINVIGGISLQVPAAFTDTEYPIAGRENDMCSGDVTLACRYETIHFDAGRQQMDGTRALKYIRSRHAQGEQGTDFARSRRQQEVIVAVKEKIISKDVVLRPQLFGKLFGIVDQATDMDMNIGEFLTFGKLFAGVTNAHIRRISFEEELVAPPQYLYGRYVLVPKISWEDVQMFIKTKLDQ